MSEIVAVDTMYRLLLKKAGSDPALNDPDFAEFVRLVKKFIPPTSQAAYNILACAGIAFTAIETAVMRGAAGDPEIILVTRSPGDVLYALMQHSPGSMLRPSDAFAENDPELLGAGAGDAANFYQLAFLRVLVELGFTPEEVADSGLELFSQLPVFVGGFVHQTPRGAENANLFIAKIHGEPRKGKFLKLNAVLADPKAFNLIEHHIAVLYQLKYRYANFYPTLRTWQGW